METNPSITILFAATRFLHFAACLILTNTFLFDRFIIGTRGFLSPPSVSRGSAREGALLSTFNPLPTSEARWNQIKKWLVVASLPTALISGIAWFALVTINMSGLPPQEALRPTTLHLVWSQTQFGKLSQLRCILYLASFVTTTILLRLPITAQPKTKIPLTWLTLLLSATLLTTLARAGHAQIGHPNTWHLLADSLHLLTAAIWPTGLLPLTLLLLRAKPDQLTALPQLINRFSTAALLSVALLTLTGFINTCFMLHSLSDLTTTHYGQILLTKITLFLTMITLGAFNLLKLKLRLRNNYARPTPTLIPSPGTPGEGQGEGLQKNGDPKIVQPPRPAMPRAVRSLQTTVAIELLLATAIILAVAILGLTPPPQM